MNKETKYLNFLAEIAKEKTPVAGSRVAAAIVYKKTLVIVGENANRTDPWAARFAKNPEALTIHAEVQAIKNANNHFRGDRNCCQGATMYVCRVKKDGPKGNWIWGDTTPCQGCMVALDLYGIKKVVFTTDDKEYDEIRL